ncbi:MAG TPA: hypothetical protein VD867_07575 [Burkholderiales bacterium]|nr:hypothetical protein [Burkholderiales bacterium]
MQPADTADRTELFERLYATDLVYQPDCWKLCGDAHCCSFKRYKSRFRIVGRSDSQDLPLLPGEFDFLEARGWTGQFQDFIRHAQPYDFGPGTAVLDTVSSRRPGCRCDHDTRTVICRLYPLLPVFDVDGHLVGTEAMGVFEELEHLEGLAPACQISALPFAQMGLFLRICELLASDPVVLFHLEAYRRTKRHVFDRLAQAKATTGKSAFALYEGAFLRQRLFDHDALKADLAGLHGSFEARYGRRYTAGMMQMRAPREVA